MIATAGKARASVQEANLPLKFPARLPAMIAKKKSKTASSCQGNCTNASGRTAPHINDRWLVMKAYKSARAPAERTTFLDLADVRDSKTTVEPVTAVRSRGMPIYVERE